MSEKAKQRFLVAWLVILTVWVSILSWDTLTRFTGREQRIQQWNERMMQDSIQRLRMPMQIDSLKAEIRQLKQRQSSFLQVPQSWLDEIASATVPGSIFVLCWTAASIIIAAQWSAARKDRKLYDERLKQKDEAYNELVRKVVEPLLADMSLIVRDK